MRDILFIALFLTDLSTSYKILIVSPKMAHSHVAFLGKIADILVEAGNDVTVLLSQMNARLASNGTKLAKTIVLPGHPRALQVFSAVAGPGQWMKNINNPFSHVKVMSTKAEACALQCEKDISNTEVLNRLKEEKFDLGISVVFDICGHGIFHVLGIPAHISAGTTVLLEGVMYDMGIPLLPSYVPGLVSPTSDEMSYKERIINAVSIGLSLFYHWYIVRWEQDVFRRHFGDDFIDLHEKIAQSTFVISNTDPLLDFPRPTSHRIIDVAGVTVAAAAPLDEHWQKVLSEKAQTILVSFGSVARSEMMPSSMKKAMLECFARFPRTTFIWKYEDENDNFAEGYPNVVLTKWTPQNDLLRIMRMKEDFVNSRHESRCHVEEILLESKEKGNIE